MCSAHQIRVCLILVIGDFPVERAKGHLVHDFVFLQRLIKNINAFHSHFARILNFDYKAVIAGTCKICQSIIKTQNFQIFRHVFAVQILIWAASVICGKTGAHVELP